MAGGFCELGIHLLGIRTINKSPIYCFRVYIKAPDFFVPLLHGALYGAMVISMGHIVLRATVRASIIANAMVPEYQMTQTYLNMMLATV